MDMSSSRTNELAVAGRRIRVVCQFDSRFGFRSAQDESNRSTTRTNNSVSEASHNEAQRQRWLPKMATGEMVRAIAMTEPHTGSDLQNVRATAVRDGDDYVINGAKSYITNGQQADLVIVEAKTDPAQGAKDISLLVMEADTPGFQRGATSRKWGSAPRTPRSSPVQCGSFSSSWGAGRGVRWNFGRARPNEYTPSRKSIWKWMLRLSAEPKRWIRVTAPVFAPEATVNPVLLRRSVEIAR